jgi:tetratricopeptide (TPR) repeat protein
MRARTLHAPRRRVLAVVSSALFAIAAAAQTGAVDQHAAAGKGGVATIVNGSDNRVSINTIDPETAANLRKLARDAPRLMMQIKRAIAELEALEKNPATAQKANRAISALQSGDARPSVALLRDQETSAEQDARASGQAHGDALHRAAELARQQGALAFVSDTNAALAAYRRAQTYEPDEPNTLISIGDLQDTLGQTQAALATYDRAREVIEQRLENEPGNVEMQRDLAVTSSRTASEIGKLGDISAALSRYNEALDQLQKLAAAHPGNVDLQRDVAATHGMLAGALTFAGKSSEALDQVNRNVAILDTLARAHPENADVQLSLALALMRKSDQLAMQGEHTEALATLRSAAPLIDRLSEREASAQSTLRVISASTATLDDARFYLHMQLGVALKLTGDFKGAIQEFDTAFASAQTQARHDPDSADAQKHLLSLHAERADALSSIGRHNEALVEYRQALALAQQLNAREPGDRLLQGAAATARLGIAAILIMLKDPSAATELHAAIAQLEPLAKADPTNAAWRSNLATAHMLLSNDAARTGNVAELLAESQAALDIYEPLLESDPTNTMWQMGTAETELLRSIQLQKAGDVTQAERAARRCVDLFDAMVRRDPGDTLAQTLLGSCYSRLAATSPREDDQKTYRDRADAIFAALKARGSLMPIDPTDSPVQQAGTPAR